jgi:hypothetical protein
MASLVFACVCAWAAALPQPHRGAPAAALGTTVQVGPIRSAEPQLVHPNFVGLSIEVRDEPPHLSQPASHLPPPWPALHAGP